MLVLCSFSFSFSILITVTALSGLFSLKNKVGIRSTAGGLRQEVFNASNLCARLHDLISYFNFSCSSIVSLPSGCHGVKISWVLELNDQARLTLWQLRDAHNVLCLFALSNREPLATRGDQPHLKQADVTEKLNAQVDHRGFLLLTVLSRAVRAPPGAC